MNPSDFFFILKWWQKHLISKSEVQLWDVDHQNPKRLIRMWKKCELHFQGQWHGRKLMTIIFRWRRSSSFEARDLFLPVWPKLLRMNTQCRSLESSMAWHGSTQNSQRPSRWCLQHIVPHAVPAAAAASAGFFFHHFGFGKREEASKGGLDWEP